MVLVGGLGLPTLDPRGRTRPEPDPDLVSIPEGEPLVVDLLSGKPLFYLKGHDEHVYGLS